ncbi:effector-associated constant component EACC1 [Microtetraspora malaysiensis]|uniref:effector-associated constant component EACC1 n=1 Tax=Microtetraspora malaysiensis TaxID=161358 RepID=UPI003D91DD7D
MEGDVDGRGLLPWLLNDPVSRDASLSAIGRPGEMGVGEVIQAVVENSISLGELILSIAMWRDSRRHGQGQQTELRIELHGVVVKVTGSKPEDIAATVSALMKARNHGDGDDPSSIAS